MTIRTRDLLPVYMMDQRWLDLADVIDHVLGPDAPSALEDKALANIRTLFVTNAIIEDAADKGKLFNFADWDMPERELAIKQVNLLGAPFSNPKYLTRNGLVNVSRNLGQYWHQKGLYTFADFVGFTLGLDLTIQNMWTENYKDFYPEGDPAIGNSVWAGGTWYPTTHVNLMYNATTYDDTMLSAVYDLFYDLANYNLVLNTLRTDIISSIVTEVETPLAAPQITPTTIVAAAAYVVDTYTLDTAA